MSEPFGIAAGSVGIAAAFAACVECFGYIQHGRHFGRDYQTELISLDCARLRLTRWGAAVNIHGDPSIGRPDATASEVQTVQNALHQILVLFADSAEISKQYKLKNKNKDALALLAPGDLDRDVLGLRNKMQELAIKRQKGAGFLKTGSWALYGRAELKSLVSGITALVDNIEKLFPAPEARLAALVGQETSAIQDRSALELVETAACNVDGLLRTAAKEALTGHHYSNVVIKGKAQTGDAFSSDWTRGAIGANHIYDGVTVDETGKALLGTKYGGKDFWDD